MASTEHEIASGQGQPRRVRVTHDIHPAMQYEFYIPEAIWNHAAVRRMLTRLEALAPGATSFSRLAGIWDHKPETVRIYRIILRCEEPGLEGIRQVLREQVGQLMAEVAGEARSAQEAFMFTETAVQVTMSHL